MKGKVVFVLLSLALFIASVWLYVTRATSKINIRSTADEPKIVLRDYEFYRVKDDLVVARMAGATASLYDGGKILMTDGVRGVRILGQRREELSSKRAEVYLSGNNTGINGTIDRVSKVRVSESVDLMVGEARMETEDATYTDEDSTIRSAVPVRVEKTGQFLAGERGFEYNVKAESLKMKGGITGTVYPKSLQPPPPVKDQQ